MNTGAEAVETAIKAARKWGYTVKGIPADEAEILVFAGNFHGRTTTIVGFSSDEEYRFGFGSVHPRLSNSPLWRCRCRGRGHARQGGSCFGGADSGRGRDRHPTRRLPAPPPRDHRTITTPC